MAEAQPATDPADAPSTAVVGDAAAFSIVAPQPQPAVVPAVAAAAPGTASGVLPADALALRAAATQAGPAAPAGAPRTTAPAPAPAAGEALSQVGGGRPVATATAPATVATATAPAISADAASPATNGNAASPTANGSAASPTVDSSAGSPAVNAPAAQPVVSPAPATGDQPATAIGVPTEAPADAPAAGAPSTPAVRATETLAPAPAAAPAAAPAQPAAAPGPAPALAPSLAAAPQLEGPVAAQPAVLDALVELASRRGNATARIALAPEQLGGIRVMLEVAADGVTARLIADRPEAAAALQRAGGDLRAALEQQGITLASLETGVAGEGAGARERRAGESTDGHTGPRTATPAADEAPTAIRVTLSAPGALSPGRTIDLHA